LPSAHPGPELGQPLRTRTADLDMHARRQGHQRNTHFMMDWMNDRQMEARLRAWLEADFPQDRTG